jgi:cytochrome P450
VATAAAPDIVTPPASFSILGSLLSGQSVPYFAARVGARFGKWLGHPLRLGSKVVAVRHADVQELLSRDLDFLIAPVNRTKIEEVNDAFILGLDRSAVLVEERHALYAGLSAVDLDALGDRLRARVAQRSAGLPARFDAISDFARPIAAETASDLFGVGSADLGLLAEIARAIFAHIFLNIGNDPKVRARALAAAPIMRKMLEEEIARRRKKKEPGTDFMGQLLRQGLLNDDGVRRTIGGMLVGSIDTTTTAVAKIVCVALKAPSLQRSIVEAFDHGDDVYGWCLEALRRWPHNPILLRRAGADTSLAGTPVKAGEQVIAWTQAAMLDPTAFPDPLTLFGNRDRSAYVHYGYGLHPCAGRVVNAIQIPLLVATLLSRDMVRAGRLKWAGPFPDHLPLKNRKG